jgi:protein required for attachment to host cells
MSWQNILKKVRNFVVTEVDYETDEHDQDDLDTTFQQMVVTADELDIEEDDMQEEIEERLANWISEETGWLVNAFSFHEVMQ